MLRDLLSTKQERRSLPLCAPIAVIGDLIKSSRSPFAPTEFHDMFRTAVNDGASDRQNVYSRRKQSFKRGGSVFVILTRMLMLALLFGGTATHANDLNCVSAVGHIKQGIIEYDELTSREPTANAVRRERVLREKVGDSFEPRCMSQLSSLRDTINVEKTASGVTLYNWHDGHRYGFSIDRYGRTELFYVILK
jgi:hypothetical protein